MRVKQLKIMTNDPQKLLHREQTITQDTSALDVTET